MNTSSDEKRAGKKEASDDITPQAVDDAGANDADASDIADAATSRFASGGSSASDNLQQASGLDGKQHTGISRSISRRALIYGTAGIAALFALGGGLRLTFGAVVPLRPPGGQNEAEFAARCIKCDRCRSACHLGAIGVASVNNGLLNARTPTMQFRRGYCDFCAGVPDHRAVDGTDPGLLCVANCPTGALMPFDKAAEWIAPAVIDAEECVAFKTRGACGICADRCPFEAISLDTNLRPVVNEDKCNGCGYCEFICPSNSYRSYSGSNRRGVNVERREGRRP
ncbi:MAG: 4Fe-4S dicluster domain-containing protein [Coriobacteriales bacterium]|nr:4Fe-4S dicluster domain-containing protein [Coriobacteriales bacterium]